MAIVADVDNFDLVVGPHEYSAEELEELRNAIQKRRDPESDAILSQRALRLLVHDAPARDGAISTANLCTNYAQDENQFTNGLLSILMLSRCEEPEFVHYFLRDLLDITVHEQLHTFRVLRNITGTVDGEICGGKCCIHWESKITSGSLRRDQIDSHLRELSVRPEKLKKLVLLTPDDGKSRYIAQFLSIAPESLRHLQWRRVYDFLGDWQQKKDISRVFGEVLRQFLERIRQRVFEQDIAGVVCKIEFGKRSDVYSSDYLDEMRAGKWSEWNTPREYKNLDGTGRKLLLYDRERKGITVEVEIESVENTHADAKYPWRNSFAPGTLVVHDPPIPVQRIRRIRGFENFGIYRKDRSAYRNITREQYRELMG